MLTPFSGAPQGAPPAPWRAVGLPARNHVPLTPMDVVALDRQSVLRLRTDHSYGTLSHALPATTRAGTLRWRWRLDQPLPGGTSLGYLGDLSLMEQ